MHYIRNMHSLKPIFANVQLDEELLTANFSCGGLYYSYRNEKVLHVFFFGVVSPLLRVEIRSAGCGRRAANCLFREGRKR
jgi:hypothetical protein